MDPLLQTSAPHFGIAVVRFFKHARIWTRRLSESKPVDRMQVEPVSLALKRIRWQPHSQAIRWIDVAPVDRNARNPEPRDGIEEAARVVAVLADGGDPSERSI